jgi:tetratricopeptide (TPR) repeat protein
MAGAGPIGCASDETLVRMAGRAVPPDELETLRDHVDDCDVCGAALLALIRTTAAPPTVTADMPAGTQIGRFVLRDVLGSGNMGTVFTAWDPQLDRTVAIKVLRAGRNGPRDAERLLREAKAMARVRHPNVVNVYEVGQDQDVVFIAMEQVRGTTLRARITGDQVPVRVRLEWLAQVARALDAIHAAGLIHRDLKPDNVFVEDVAGSEHGSSADRVVIGDFGLAAADTRVSDRHHPGDLATGTRSAGTPAYMPPEQLRGGPLDARADIFAFGVMAWEVLTGTRPFTGATTADLEASIDRGPARTPALDALPHAITDVLARCVRHDREQRPDSIREVTRVLERPHGSRRRVVAIGMAGAAVLAVGALVAMRAGHGREDDRAGGALACDPAAQPRWESTRTAWLGRAQQLSPYVRDALVATMDHRANAWSREAALACARDVMAQQAWRLCRPRLEELEQRVLEVAVEQSWADDQPLIRSVDRIATPAYCGSSEAAEDAVALSALPSDAARAAVGDGLGWLARADALDDVDADAARDIALATATRIAATYSPSPLDGEVALSEVLLRPPAEPRDRIAALKAVAATAEQSGRASLIARAWLSLAGYAGRTLDERTVDLALPQADWAITRLGDPPRLRVRWLVADGSRAWGHGDQVGAKARFAAATALAGDNAVLRRTTKLAIAMLARVAGDNRQAIAVYRAFLADPEFVRREAPETLIDIEASLAEALYSIGELAEAQRSIENAIERARTGLVANHPAQIENKMIAASILLERGDKASALALLEAATAQARAAFGPDHVLVGTGLRRLAQVLIYSGRIDEGLVAARDAVRIFDLRLGRRSGRSVDARHQIADAYRETGKLEASAKEYAEVVADAEALYGTAHPMWAEPAYGQAVVLAALHRDADARALLERVIPVLAQGSTPDITASATKLQSELQRR